MTGENHAFARTRHQHGPGRGRRLVVLAAVRQPEHPARLHRRAGPAARRARRQPPAGRGQRGGTGRPAGAALGTVRPGDLEPQPRRRGRLAVLVRRQPAARPGPAGQRRTAPRAPQRHPRGTPARDRPGADSSRRAAAGEDPVADALPDRRPGQRGAGAEHRRPPAWTPAAPRSGPRAATPDGSAGVPAPRTCCPASSAAARPGRCSAPSAAPALPAAQQPRTCARPPDGPGSATTPPGSCSPGTPGGSCIGCATPRLPISANKVSRCS